MPQIGELGGRGVQRTKDQDCGAKCRKSEQGVSSSPTHVKELGTSGSSPKCRKSGSLEVGECRAQKIKIGQPSAENLSKGLLRKDCRDLSQTVGLGRDFGIWQNLVADLGVDADDGRSSLSWQRFWHACRVLDTLP